VPAKRIGLIAGYGSFPLEMARELAARGMEVHAVAAREETSAEIEHLVASTCWLHVGQVGGMIRALKKAGVSEAVMAGKVRKLHLFRNFRPDLTAMKGLMRLPDRRDDTILNAIADLLREGGITLLPQTEFAGDMLAGAGHLHGPGPSRKQQDDIAFAVRQARVIAGLDIGQTIVVQDQAVLAVEAIEGTDAAILRGGELGGGKATVVKVAKPEQDLRFDVPAIGPDTLETMHHAGCACLAVEAGRTLVLERDRFAELAKKHKITVYGFADEAASPH